MAWSPIFTYEGAGRMVVARDMFLKGLAFCGVVGAVVGLAYNGAKHMGVRWFVISNNGVFAGTIGLVPFFALEGIRCVRVLLGGLKK
ncbi:hypothetical protein [Bartonella sp. MR30HLJHH]|uniref:hypothetical protein n=1 Tax=Bartonella sp. MR30HLJHH TaxID=3243557 RepID=UPI0035D12B45